MAGNNYSMQNLPAGTWHKAYPMKKSGAILLVNADIPLVGTISKTGSWTVLKKDSVAWLSLGGYLDALAPLAGQVFTRDDVAYLLYKNLTGTNQKLLANWQTDTKSLIKVLNYGHRFVYFATYMGLLQNIAPHTWMRTDKNLLDLKQEPQQEPTSELEQAIEELIREFTERMRGLLVTR
jgi:hypothetical protein